VVTLPEDGSAKFSTDNGIGQDDEPPYDNNDTSPSIENDLNANLNMREDLEYNHVSDATQDQYELDERQLSSMAGSSTVEVKQKCRLAGNGNTSTACNQGDIRNLNIKPLHESASLNIPENLSGYDSLKIMNGDQTVGEVGIMDRGVHGGNHYIAIDKIFINKEFRGNDYANDAMKLIFAYADKNNLIVTLTPDNIWGASVPKLKAWYKSLGFIENKGKKKDFQTMQLMYRLPKTPTNLNEDIDPKTINTNRRAIYSVITGKRKLAFGEVDKPLGQAIEKRGFGIIPVRMTSRHGMMSIVYNKDSYENARKLYEIAKTHGDYLTDNTASEAREIGRLLEYKEESIAEYIKQKYGDRALSTHEKSPEDFDDLSEDMDFWDLNDLNEENFPAFEKQIEKDEITHGLDKKVLYEQDDFKVCVVNGDAVRGNGFDEWVDGGHHYVDADLPKDEQKYAKFIPEDEIWIDDVFLSKPNDMAAIILHEKLERYLMKNYGIEYENAHTDYANKAEVVFRKLVKDGTGSLISQKIFDAFVNKFIQDHSDKKKVHEGVADVAADKQFGIQQPHAGFEDKFNREENEEDVVFAGDTDGMIIIRNPKSWKNIYGYVRGIIDPEGNLYIQQKPVGIHFEMLEELNKLGLVDNEADWDEKLPTNFLTVQRYLRSNKILLGESNAPRYPEPRDPNSMFWSKIPPVEVAIPYYQAFLDKAKKKNPSMDFINEIISTYRKQHENDETFGGNDFNENLKNSDNHNDLYVENVNFAKNDSMNENEIMSLDDLPFKDDVERQGGKVYSVGGAVRDKFLGKESKDLDVIVTGIPLDKLERIISRYGVVNSVGKSYGVLKLKPRGAPEDSEDIDIVIPRTDTPTGGGGYQDFDIQSDHTIPLEKDLERRDFTINAMARDRNGEIIDPYGGQEDLKNKIIRAVNPEAFSDDPLRMLRAVQFACRFGFTIEPHTMKMIKDNVAEIKRISAERYLIEFDKIIKKGNIVMGVELLMETGLFSQIFNAQPKNVTPLFAKVKTMAEFLYLLMTGSVNNPAEFYLEHFASDEDAKRSKNYKEIRALETGFESGEATNLIEARSIAHNMYLIFPQVLESQILPNIIRVASQELLQGKYPKTVNELAVNGNDLMELGLQGKAVGDMQKSLLLKIYSNKVMNNKEDLLSLAGQNGK
jgi:tRNA nucleotidyltransferase/poly(A) polymerase